MTIAATVVAITQEIWNVKPLITKFSQITWDNINVKCAKIKVNVISTASLFLILPIILEKIYPVRNQNNTPHTNIDKNTATHSQNAVPLSSCHSEIIPKITKKSAKEVPSLNKLSHSNIVTSLLGAQILLNIVRTATVSVAEIKLPYSKQTRYGIWKPSNGNK